MTSFKIDHSLEVKIEFLLERGSTDDSDDKIQQRDLYFRKNMSLRVPGRNQVILFFYFISAALSGGKEHRDCDLHGFSSKPTPAILLRPRERHFVGLFPA